MSDAKSITLWDRLEPLTRDASLEDTLNARTADPLWMLARQWQLGEFRGEDAGSPVEAHISVQSDKLSRFRLGDSASGQSGDRGGEFGGQSYDHQPLEVIVEREGGPTASFGDNLERAVEAGMMLLRLLNRKVDKQVRPEDFKSAYRIQGPSTDNSDLEDVEPETRRYLRVTGGTAVDGTAVYRALTNESNGDSAGSINSLLDDSAPDLDPNSVKSEYEQWYENLFSQPKGSVSGDIGEGHSTAPEAWDLSRFEYSFALETSEGLELHAPEYLGDNLDWFDFSVVRPTRDLDKDLNKSKTPTERLIPTPVQFPGMPKPRFWEFEEGDVDLTSITAAAEDLSRLVFLEFALVYGNDWFSLPVSVPFGSLASISELTIYNTFGEDITIDRVGAENTSAERWQMFGLSADDLEEDGSKEGEEGLFVPPVLVDSLKSEEPIEEVAFARDEMVNAAWAIEQVVPGRTGQRIHRSEEQRRTVDTKSSGGGSENGDGSEESQRLPSWVLATDIPEFWYPFLPRPGSTAAKQLVVGSVLDEDREHPPPQGTVLKPYTIDASSEDGETSPFIYEEEIPREGLKLERYTQLAGWLDGSLYLWRARRKEPGQGERSSGLRFDALKEPETPNSQRSS